MIKGYCGMKLNVYPNAMLIMKNVKAINLERISLNKKLSFPKNTVYLKMTFKIQFCNLKLQQTSVKLNKINFISNQVDSFQNDLSNLHMKRLVRYN